MSLRAAEKSLVETLQCPVCVAFPTAPIYGCQNGHIICHSCQEYSKHCPICRSEKFNVRNIIAETLLKSPVLKCPYRRCPKPRMTGDQYTSHVKDCDYREVECHCKFGEQECYGALVPKIDYIKHIKECHGAKKSSPVTCVVRCEMSGNFTPTRFSCFGENFLLMSHKNYDGTRFWTWVTHENKRGLDQKFLIKITLRYYFGREEIKVHSEVFPPSKIQDTPEKVLESRQCMEFTDTTAPLNMPLMVCPGYFPGVDNQPGFMWSYDVEVTELVEKRRGKKTLSTPTATNVANPTVVAASVSRPHQQNRQIVIQFTTENGQIINMDNLVHQLQNFGKENRPAGLNALNQLSNEAQSQILNNILPGLHNILNNVLDDLAIAIRNFVPTGTDLNQLLNEINNTQANLMAAAADFNVENLNGNELNNIQNPAAVAPPELATFEDQTLNAEELQEFEEYFSSEDDEQLDRDKRIRTAENRSRSPSPLEKRMATGENEVGQPLEPNTNDQHDFLNDGSGDDDPDYTPVYAGSDENL